MDPVLIALKNYLVFETATNSDLLTRRLTELAEVLPRDYTIALLETYKLKVVLELERKKETLSQELTTVEEQLKVLNETGR